MLRIASLALLGMFSCGAVAATITFDPVPAQQLRLMTADEQEAHRKALLKLRGAEREAYRNQVYQDLRVRARNQGYLLPKVPPWGLTDDVPKDAPPVTASTAPPNQIEAEIAAHRKEIEARHARHKQEFEERRARLEAVRKAQREKMRERLDAALEEPPRPPAFRPAPPPPAGYARPPVYYPYPPSWPAPYYGPYGY